MAKPPSELDTLIRETITALGYDFVGCEYFAQQGGPLLRVYLEQLEGNISVDACAEASRQLHAVLAVEESLPANYTLEVSSPGIERPIFNAAQYTKFQGQTVKIRLYTALDGQRSFIGSIIVADEQTLTLDIEGESRVFSMSEIDKARLVVAFDI